MLHSRLILTLAVLSVFVFGQHDFSIAADGKAPAYTSVEELKDDPDFNLQGEYLRRGEGIQVVALGDGLFRTVIYSGGLPGANWNRQPPRVLELDQDSVLDLVEDFEKQNRVSPTMGLKAPEGAVVLFDGTEETFKANWSENSRITDDGLLQEGATSKPTFSDYSLHLEFRLPYMPTARGQGRGNSGLYLQGRYEVQMLDSFGLEGKNNECGGIYSIGAPSQNMCFPPLTWQTYDVELRAARFNDKGEKTENARVTVRHNGVVIHRDIELPKTTPGGPSKDTADPGPVFLQNHGNPVRYRNIWVVPKDYSKVTARPKVPAFERFHADVLGHDVSGGKLLIGELECANCHQLPGNVTAGLLKREAPKLTDVGSRISPLYLREFLASPHDVKPGSTMPNLFETVPEAERAQAVEAVVQFLASTGSFRQQPLNRDAVNKGRSLFQSVGCLACHDKQEQETENATTGSTSVPLMGLDKKYSVSSLAEFLKNPHAVRASGRMPNLMLEKDEPTQIASYLLRNQDPNSLNPSWNYHVYYQSLQKLQPIPSTPPDSAGVSPSLDVTVAGRKDNFRLVFRGQLKISQAGDYRFRLGSDDGSRLTIEGKDLIEVDGIHPFSTREEGVRLEAGFHEIVVDYFEAGGEEKLELLISGPGISMQDVSAMVRPTQEDFEKETQTAGDQNQFEKDPTLTESGKKWFGQLGCANCHELKIGGQQLATTVPVSPLKLDALDKGCLSEKPADKAPQYDLSDSQRAAVLSALKAAPEELTAAAQLDYNFEAFNCYACHSRSAKGGPEASRNEQFVSTIPEMGDEGRLPPPIDGVGDKLTKSWLNHILNQGAKDRPYMLTRMPKFGGDVARLTDLFISLDEKTEAKIVEAPEPAQRVKGTGRKLVGGGSLSCVKCHTFGKIPATGIQAIDLLTMTKRIREDWFHRYLVDPVKYRPGTRMPNVFPDGVSADRDVYHGEPGPQISAMWQYLLDGDKAAVPYGLLPDPIELVPGKEPIIYRNFIEDVNPRGIAVGYPEGANITFDAELLSLRLIWHGAFIDAGKHWRGRGQGTQVPLGDHVIPLPKLPAIASIESLDAAWPAETAKERGAKFLGYELDENRRPLFHYRTAGMNVTESYTPQARKEGAPGLLRTLRCEPAQNNESSVYFLAAQGVKIESTGSGKYSVTDQNENVYQIEIQGAAGEPALREQGGQQELIFPVDAKSGSTIQQRIQW